MHCALVSAHLLYIDKFSLNLLDVNECETDPLRVVRYVEIQLVVSCAVVFQDIP